MTYISFFNDGLSEVFLTGGLGPLVDHPDPVYQRLIRKLLHTTYITCFSSSVCYIARIIKRNLVYYEKYPLDIQRVFRAHPFVS